MLTRTLERLLSATGIPEPLPDDPFPTLEQWLRDAAANGAYADPNAMALATSTPDGGPSVRIVLCKAIEPDRRSLTFFTNYLSRKGRELASNPRAAAVFHWPHAKRQARVEGVTERLSDEENDAYYATRPLISRIGAAASRQSEVIASRSELLSRAARIAAESCLERGPRRPDCWGGFRLRAHSVELWSGAEGRLHQRVRWRLADGTADGVAAGRPWIREELSP